MPVTRATKKKHGPKKKAAASKKSTKKLNRKPVPKNPCTTPNSGYASFLRTRNDGTQFRRCMPKKCTRSKDSRFHYTRPADGYCGKVMDHLGSKAKIEEYIKYRKNLAKLSRERSVAAKKI